MTLHDSQGQQMLDAMAAEIGACTVLRDCIIRQRQAFVERDLEGLTKATAAVELAARDVSRAAAARREAARGSGAQGLGAADARRCERARKVQQEAWFDLRREAQFSGELIGDALSCTRALLRVLTGSDDAVSLRGLLQAGRA